jgi:phosphoglucosamine mutase
MTHKLFGTSGIRRKAEELTDEFAYDLGRAAGTYSKSKAIVIGRDPRKSSPRLEFSLISGIISTGKDVILLGVVPTPVVGIASLDYGAGIMITASHNPPEYNGFKFWNKHGAYNPEQEAGLEKVFHSKDFLKSERLGEIKEESYVDRYIKLVLKKVGKVKKRIKVFVDCANGAGAVITPRLLREMGCDVIAINTEMEGVFAHGLEPTKKNLAGVCLQMKKSGADVGIVHDGDADRSAAIDREGDLVDWDSFLSVLAYGKKLVVTTVDASMRIEDVCGKVVRTPVGDVAVANAIVRDKADFGGEPSGSYIFPEVHLFPDGPLTAAYVAKMVSEDRFYETLAKIKVYPTERVKIPCPDSKKKDAMNKIKELLKHEKNVTNIDGLRIAKKDGWVLIRPSGTEPYLRITAEAHDDNALKEIVDEARKLVDEALAY